MKINTGFVRIALFTRYNALKCLYNKHKMIYYNYICIFKMTVNYCPFSAT